VIITVTLNPSLDLTYALRESAVGEVDVHRARTATLEASGKGVNVSLTLRRAGTPTVAVLPLAGPTGRHVSDLLTKEEVEHVVVPLEGQTRINTSVVVPGGQTTKVNGPGPMVGAEELTLLTRRLREVVDAVDHEGEHWVALCGSFPPGVEEGLVTEVVRTARERGLRCAVDVAGPPLAQALTDGADLLAPNAEELGALVPDGLDHRDPGAVVSAAHHLARASGTSFLVSLGAEGALYADGAVTLHGTGPALTPVNTAGAGDALLAGWLTQPGEPTARLRRALAYGRSACLSPLTVDRTPGRNAADGLTVATLSASPRQRKNR